MRYVLNKTTFQKGSAPKWSKSTHTIESKEVNRYKLSNGQLYRDYELQAISGNESKPAEPEEIDNSELTPIERKPKPQRRFIRKEGLELSNAVETRRVPRSRDIGPYLSGKGQLLS